jgi:trehalose 6-phosphate synthase
VLAGLYRTARVGLVTPFRDGMNLVAKEYVAAQDPDDPGVLVLSRFVGAAIAFRAALLVNPYNAESVAAALAQALAMPLEERRVRDKALFASVCEHYIDRWQREFLQALRDGDGDVLDTSPVIRPMASSPAERPSAFFPDATVRWNRSTNWRHCASKSIGIEAVFSLCPSIVGGDLVSTAAHDDDVEALGSSTRDRRCSA